MGYAIAINKAWDNLIQLTTEKNFSVKFLADEYTIDSQKKSVFSLSCNVPAKDFTAILILHYLAQRIKGLPQLTGEWQVFRELAGIEGYYPTFRERAIEPIIRKYGSKPEEILSALKRLPGKKADLADISIIVEAFEGIPVLIKLMRADEEFGPEANILFDRSVAQIFCIEDIIVLAGIVAGSI
ncbi:MAG: DUF3786 domain-containing protein [Candidatus Omnitrophica bacterium]|nr:DUF3786 domain-containing protein [Candidatus Omnitrophota bacterium]MDD5238395.1 DUF3786 domain-containing protein [Candidatus Omnitrophota bacterium]